MTFYFSSSMTFFLRKRNKSYSNLVLEAAAKHRVDWDSLPELYVIGDKAMNYFLITPYSVCSMV